MLGRRTCADVHRFHQVCEGLRQYIDNQQSFLDPDQLPKGKGSNLYLLSHPSWNITWIWSYGHNVLLCLHQHTHTHPCTLFLALINLKVLGVFSTRIYFEHEDKGHSLKAERSLFSLCGCFSRLKGFLPYPNFCLFLTFLLSFSGHRAKHVRRWPTLSTYYNLLKPLPFQTNLFLYGIFHKNYLKILWEEVKLWWNGWSILKILGCEDQELSTFQ